MLQTFAARNNALTGAVPTEFGACTALKELFASGNDFNSGIPSEIGLLTNLSTFRVKLHMLPKVSFI